MNMPNGFINGNGIIKEDALEQDIKDAIRSITGGWTGMYRCKDGSYTFSGLIVNDDEGWQKRFADLLKKYFLSATFDLDVQDEKERFWMVNGEVKAVMGETMTYYEGFEDEFILQIPDKVLSVIEQRVKEREGLQ